ncbi:hypothetical protein JTE90_002836 [Oedothorax gibbosus]|uniref:Uncharacterized protein n=1 Tax=Oedothorax gibbosus TaxID=931172 RepID=A0AAV6UGX0_9ARAC|nr:hypothetical protein JTE90_002836 [Oedothorax gibbosus]
MWERGMEEIRDARTADADAPWSGIYDGDAGDAVSNPLTTAELFIGRRGRGGGAMQMRRRSITTAERDRTEEGEDAKV